MAKKTIAELEEEIFYLQQQLAKQKERLQFLEEHFRSCRTAFPISPPPDRHCNEISIRPTLEQPPVDERGSTTVCTHYEGLAGHSDIPVEQTALTNAEACHPTSPVSLQPDHHHDPVIRASRTALVIDGDVPVKYSLANSKAHSTPSTLKDHASDPNTTANTSGGQVPGTRKRRWEDNASILTTKFKLTKRARVTTSKQPQRELRHEPLDLKSLLGHDALVTSIIHGTTCSMQALSTNSTLHPIAAARRYANMAKDSRVQAKFASPIASFQDLIFHSMCVVLIHCGYSVEDVDTVMRNRSSTSAPKNLQRLRNGAAWANEVISETTEGEWTGISDCIAELYFYHDIKMSMYGSLADSREESKSFFVRHLSQIEFQTLPRPWCIPAFVRIVLPAPEITLEDICVALSYKRSAAPSVQKIVDEYKDGVCRVLQWQSHTLRELSQREGLLGSPMDCPPRLSRGSPTRDGRRTSAEATTPTLPVTASSSGNGSAETFDLGAFELSSYASGPEFDLSMFASPADFELSLVAEQLHSGSPTSQLYNE